RATSWLAWSVCGLTAVLIACAVALAFLNGSADVRAVIFPLCLTLTAVVGGLVASRRPANLVGWFFLDSGGCFATTIVATEYATYRLAGAQATAWLQSWLWVPGVMLLLCFLPLYFPDGRLVSRRWRWVVRLALFSCVTGAAFYALSPGEIPETEGIDNPLGIEALRSVSDLLAQVYLALYFFLFFASAASLVVRFRRSGSLERQQIKWLAFAASAVPVWFLTNAPIEAASRTLFDVMEALIFVALIPIAAGVAILRYRLYDIDVIINRTLVYGALTAMLVLVYISSVVSLQAALRVLTGQEETLAIVASTLVIAALFGPLRRRLQELVDRRFYRRKYDAAKTLEAFNARLRDRTDLEALSADLVGVARETMQPEHASLWLRSDTLPKAARPA
ncbi:MAG TPA: hypothetical protein VGV91_05950, partial [Rubrobacter sp.]|nr:hypothetical protein [Rubrobacter sp.]